MNEAILTRRESTDQGTCGVLSFGSEYTFSLELPWRDNRPQLSCIPKGTYTCAIVNSPKFGKVYEVKNVPNRGNVLIHSANVAGDTTLGYDTQLHGCIAPNMKLGLMRNSKGVMQLAGLISRPALSKFMSWADSKPFTLRIQ
jgi:Family of unknown function (DUF5675)